ncbi:hypothetical protein M011DRAFT_470729 [Sporormia fimetaria CBS 119925]|uniref:Uncharacterized protein n=1 Tax=Sporormia fimetaria CBS 119925 TaxID=1340428 RepID=A0A6A6V213_9PLEO|nr:hypothetical protein M011DRAFT_470729 [Sporormia fimetaria CBS 119925]
MASQSEASDILHRLQHEITGEDSAMSLSQLDHGGLFTSVEQRATLSAFEAIFTSYPPLLESLLDQLPTSSILDLYHTSGHLRNFLRSYPLAWKTLSFRLPMPAPTPGTDTPDSRERGQKQYALAALLEGIVRPNGTCLTSLDLCNTAVPGNYIIRNVLDPRSASLQHLSVRGCKNVSIKYHIIPFLEPYTIKNSSWEPSQLALKSLYTYRCRHHRRRPYLPSSLGRRDSDSDPTHQLIEICHKLGIWTDTAWCPSPGGRCFRRKDYHAGRASGQNTEVWVPFDRLWRSQNRIGPSNGGSCLGSNDGRLWEIAETGQDGEPLGTENSQFKGEGKHIPTHLRKSHRMFVEDVHCAHCKEPILERCESCSVRMHCMGCRKTLCASCAFNRPLPRKRVKTQNFASLPFGPMSGISTIFHPSGSSTSFGEQNGDIQEANDRFWWAPGVTRSPNLMNENMPDDETSDTEDGFNDALAFPPPHIRDPPKLNMYWCCLEPVFSGGGGIAVVGHAFTGKGADKIRVAPLPRKKGFEDPDFSNQLRPIDYVKELKNNGLYEYVLGEDVDVLSYLKQESLEGQVHTSPRSLCQDCYRSFRWKVSCRSCKYPLCKEHDFRGLKFRKCGYRDMHIEREYARSHQQQPPQLVIPVFNPKTTKGKLPDAGLAAPSNLTTDFGNSDPMSQSQILLPSLVSARSAPSQTSGPQHTAAETFHVSSTLPFQPVSASRPRSLSASGVRSRSSDLSDKPPRGQVTAVTNPLPLPCNGRHPVQWEGCGAYFCPYPRGGGDIRPPCHALIRECSDCGVLACDSCVSANPICPCTYCTVNFYCPHCVRKPENRALCRLEDELRAQEEAKQRAKEKMEKEKEDRGKADSVAGAAFEFWKLMGDVWTLNDVEGAEEADVTHHGSTDGPLIPSPDSITVTTEFGVSEEPNNITFISAGPSVHAQTSAYSAERDGDLDSADENPDDMPQHNISTNASLMGPTLNSALPSVMESLVLGITSDDLGDDDSDDVELDEQEDEDDDTFDAESAVIDEFLDDPSFLQTTASAVPSTNSADGPS